MPTRSMHCPVQLFNHQRDIIFSMPMRVSCQLSLVSQVTLVIGSTVKVVKQRHHYNCRQTGLLVNLIEIRLKTMLKIESALVMVSFDNRRDESSGISNIGGVGSKGRPVPFVRVLFCFIFYCFYFIFFMLSCVCHE